MRRQLPKVSQDRRGQTSGRLPNRRSAGPRAESLEDRRLFAVVLGLDGAGRLKSLTAANDAQTAGVILTAQSGNKLTVAEGTTVRGMFKVAPTLTIDLGDNAAGFVDGINLNNRTLTTNIRVTLGDTAAGINQFGLTTGPGGVGTLNGEYTVRGGDTASEFVVFGEFGQTVSRTVRITGSVDIDMGDGGSDPNAGPPDAVATVGTGPANTVLDVGGNLTVHGSTVLALSGTVGGNLVSDSSDKPIGQLVILGNFGHPFTVNGDVTLLTGSANDDIELQGVLIRGDLLIRSGYGNDKVLLTGDEEEAPGAIAARVRGDLRVDLGAGDDTADLTRAAVGGRDLTITGGAGADTVTVKRLTAVTSHMVVRLGAGDDAFRFADAAAVKLADLLVDGGAGSDTYNGGAGNTFGFPIVRKDI